MIRPIIQVDNVHESYLMGKEAVPALRGVTINAPKGEMLCLMGPSGSGKTTRLNLLGGLDELGRGHIMIEGQNIVAMKEEQIARLRLTFTLRVTNTGSVDLHATITDTLPDHVTPIGVITWTTNLPAPGGVWTRTVVVTVTRGYSGTPTNRVQVTTPEGATGESQVTVRAMGYQVFLPIVLRQ